MPRRKLLLATNPRLASKGAKPAVATSSKNKAAAGKNENSAGNKPGQQYYRVNPKNSYSNEEFFCKNVEDGPDIQTGCGARSVGAQIKLDMIRVWGTVVDFLMDMIIMRRGLHTLKDETDLGLYCAPLASLGASGRSPVLSVVTLWLMFLLKQDSEIR